MEIGPSKNRSLLFPFCTRTINFCPTVVYQTENLGAIRFDERWRFVQDLDFVLRVLESGHQVVDIAQACHEYRRHTQNETVEYTVSNLRFREENTLFLELAVRCRSRGWNHAAKVARRRTIIKLNLAYCTLLDILALKWRDAWIKVKLFGELFFRKQSVTQPETTS